MRTAVVLVAIMGVLAACGGDVQPSTSEPSVAQASSPATPPPTPVATPDPAAGVGALARYTDAMCPIFLDLLLLDPRLASMRADGSAPEETLTDADELAEVTGALSGIIADLGRVPRWTPGDLLQLELLTSLHGIRVALAGVEEELGGQGAAESLAGIPLISSQRMDLAMQRAAGAGLDCGGFE